MCVTDIQRVCALYLRACVLVQRTCECVRTASVQMCVYVCGVCIVYSCVLRACVPARLLVSVCVCTVRVCGSVCALCVRVRMCVCCARVGVCIARVCVQRPHAVRGGGALHQPWQARPHWRGAGQCVRAHLYHALHARVVSCRVVSCRVVSCRD